MEEVTTCSTCGGQTWEIYGDRIVCCECRRAYAVRVAGAILSKINHPEECKNKLRRKFLRWLRGNL